MTATATATLQPEETALSPVSRSRSSLQWPVLLIAGLTVYIGIMIRGSYYFADDFLTFGYAHQIGLRWSLVFLNLFGHVAPTERLLHYLPLAVSPFNYAVAEVVILVIYVALLLSFLWLLRELCVSPAVELTLLFLVGTSTILLNETLYYDQTVFLLPASAFILCVAALFVRWTRTGRPWALYASWIVFAASFVTQERPLVVLVYLVLLRYLLLPYRVAPGGRRRWLSDWRIWLPYAAIAAAYVGYYLSIAPHSKTDTSLVVQFVQLTSKIFMRLSIGLPVSGSTWLTLAELAVLASALIAVLVFSSRRALVLRAAVFFVVCFLVNLGPVLHGLGGIIGASGVAGQVQYYVDALFALGIAVGVVCSDWIWSSFSSRRQARHAKEREHRGVRSPWGIVACMAVIVIHIASLPYGVSSIRQGNAAQPIGRAWVGQLRHSFAALRTSPATVIPLTMPASFDPGFESPYNLESEVFPMIPEWRNEDTGPVEIAGPTGALIPTSAGDSVSSGGAALGFATVNLVPTGRDGSGGPCYRSSNAQGELTLPLLRPVTGGVVAGDFTIHAFTPFSGQALSAYGDKTDMSLAPATASAGVSRLLVAFPGTPVSTVGFSNIPAGSRFCIDSMQVGSVRVAAFSGICQTIDLYGNPKGEVGCGVPWQGRVRASTPSPVLPTR